MDTSDTYRRMCANNELQMEWKPEEGDYFWTGMDVRLACDYENWSGDVSWIETFPKRRWLPRQDQIQGMIGESIYGLMMGVFDFFGSRSCPKVETGEQLWLAFYMHEKFRKTWTGTKWIKVSNGGNTGEK